MAQTLMTNSSAEECLSGPLNRIGKVGYVIGFANELGHLDYRVFVLGIKYHCLQSH